MFFGAGGVELLLMLVLVGVVALVLVTTDPWITASQTLFVEGLSVADLQGPLRGLLGSTRNSELTYSADSFVLVVRRIPGWILLGVVLTLPLGLLLLLVRRSEALLVTLEDVDGGTEVRVVGQTKQTVIRSLAKGLGSLRAPVNVR